MDCGSNQVTTSTRCWRPIKGRLERSSSNNYRQTIQFSRKTNQAFCASKRRLAFSEALLDQVSTHFKRGMMQRLHWRNWLQECQMSSHHFKKFLGYLKQTMEYCLVPDFPQAGEGYVKKGESYWCLETFTDSFCSTESQHQEDSMRWRVVHPSTAAGHRRPLAYLHAKQSYM